MITINDIPHVGEVLNEEFIIPLELSQNQLASDIGVPANRINGIVNGKRGITADTDLRLTKYFGLSEGYFLRVQDEFNTLRSKIELKDEIDNIIPFAELQKKRARATKNNDELLEM